MLKNSSKNKNMDIDIYDLELSGYFGGALERLDDPSEEDGNGGRHGQMAQGGEVANRGAHHKEGSPELTPRPIDAPNVPSTVDDHAHKVRRDHAACEANPDDKDRRKPFEIDQSLGGDV